RQVKRLGHSASGRYQWRQRLAFIRPAPSSGKTFVRQRKLPESLEWSHGGNMSLRRFRVTADPAEMLVCPLARLAFERPVGAGNRCHGGVTILSSNAPDRSARRKFQEHA